MWRRISKVKGHPQCQSDVRDISSLWYVHNEGFSMALS
jgi:hypothetical protein